MEKGANRLVDDFLRSWAIFSIVPVVRSHYDEIMFRINRFRRGGDRDDDANLLGLERWGHFWATVNLITLMGTSAFLASTPSLLMYIMIVALWVVNFYFLYTSYGHPCHWWAAYCGVSLMIWFDLDELDKWCRRNCQGFWWRRPKTHWVKFARRSDAVLARLYFKNVYQ